MRLIPDDFPPFHGIHGHGVFVDWQSDPSLPVW